MRVAILTPEPADGPKPNLRALRQCRALADAGHEPETNSVTLMGRPPAGFLSRVAYQRARTRALADMVVGTDPAPELVIAHDVYTLDAGVEVSRRLDIPLIYDAHEDWPALVGEHSRVESLAADFIERRAARRRRIAHVFAPNDWIRRRFASMGVPATTTYNARAHTEIRRIPKAEARASLGIAPDSFVVGYIGAIEQLLKGQAFRAFGNLPPSVELIVVGGPERDAKMLANIIEGSQGIRVLAPMPFEALAPYYSSLDAGLVALDGTRRNYYNSLPNKLFDYMAFGVPVLVPAFPEMKAVVVNSGAGLVYTDLGGAVRHMMGLDSVERNRMGYAAYETFMRHSWTVQAPQFVRLCEGLENSSRRA